MNVKANINGFTTDLIGFCVLARMSAYVKYINKVECRMDIDGLLLRAVHYGYDRFAIKIDYSPLDRIGWNRVKDEWNMRIKGREFFEREVIA